MFVDVGTGAPRVRAGQVRAYAVISETPSAILPEVPTMSDAGLRDFPANFGWWGLYGPAALPASVSERLGRELQVILERKDVRQKLLELGVEPAFLPAREMDSFLSEQLANWRTFLKEFKISPGS
jgi:tripartite-type tricarboxylate transporter receptor subunit TctC